MSSDLSASAFPDLYVQLGDQYKCHENDPWESIYMTEHDSNVYTVLEKRRAPFTKWCFMNNTLLEKSNR